MQTMQTIWSQLIFFFPFFFFFLESTPILALNESNSILLDTFKHISDWKERIKADERGVYLPQEWYRLQKALQYYQMTPGVNGMF